MNPPAQKNAAQTILLIVLLYIGVATLLDLLADRLLEWLIKDASVYARVHLMQEWILFAVITLIFLYFLRRELARSPRAEVSRELAVQALEEVRQELERPASSPWLTAVGGTSLGVDQANQRVLETGWGTSNYNCNTTTVACSRTGWLYGAGGGVSRIFAEPSYKTSAGLGLSGRGVPDVAALADPQTGLLVGQTQTFPDGAYYDEYRIGGTSLASPIFAGLMALADQKAGFAHGFANPLFYSHSGMFYDVQSVKTAVARRNYNNSVDASAGTADRLHTFDDYSGSPTQFTSPGWDNVTGLGTPTGIFVSQP